MREKDLPASACAALTSAAVARVRFGAEEGASPSATRILVNDRLDVALAENADGVHLGENSFAHRRSATIAPSSFVGKSAAAISRRRFLPFRGVGYGGCRGRRRLHFFGPIFATPAKQKFGEPQGVARLAEVCRSVQIPVLAIGGMNLENAAQCLDAGASGIAAIRLFQESSDLHAVAAWLRQKNRS